MKSGHEKSLFILRYPGIMQYYAYEDTREKTEVSHKMDMIKGMEPIKEQKDYAFLPSYTIYQTKYNKKEQYSAIASWVMRYEKDVHPSHGDYLMTLVDLYGLMSEEIFEHRRAIRDAARTAIQRTLHKHKGKDGWTKNTCLENYRTAYALRKACYLHMILSDLYLIKAEEALMTAVSQYNDSELSEENKKEIALILEAMEDYDPFIGGWEVLHDC